MRRRRIDRRDEIWDEYEGAEVIVSSNLGIDMTKGIVIGQDKSGMVLVKSTDGWNHGHDGNDSNIRGLISLSGDKSWYIDDKYLTIINNDFIKF